MGKEFLEGLNNFKDIKKVDKSSYEYIKSGINLFDKKIGGFIKGQISVWSGLNGSGKSAFLNQQVIEYVNQGYKVLLFSGELLDYSLQNIIYRLMAGRRNLVPSSNKIYYYVKDEEVKNNIDNYLDGKVYIYNNDYGTKANEIMQTIISAKEELDIDIVILDNLMTLDLRVYDKDKYEAQSLFSKELANLTKKLNIHTHIVAHPRKVTGYLRKMDISGSADLSNAVDNVFVIHRVNSDFKREYSLFRDGKQGDGTTIFDSYDSVIEICKNREEGVIDYFVPLYFEPITKQFVEEKGKEKNYYNTVKLFTDNSFKEDRKDNDDILDKFDNLDFLD